MCDDAVLWEDPIDTYDLDKYFGAAEICNIHPVYNFKHSKYLNGGKKNVKGRSIRIQIQTL